MVWTIKSFDFKTSIKYIYDMIYRLLKKCKFLLIGPLIISQLAVCFISPLFHQHPQQGQADVNGAFCHSRAPTNAEYNLEFDKDISDLHQAMHLPDEFRLFDEVQVSVTGQYWGKFNFCKYISRIVPFEISITAYYKPEILEITAISPAPENPIQNYHILATSGLSPPIS